MKLRESISMNSIPDLSWEHLLLEPFLLVLETHILVICDLDVLQIQLCLEIWSFDKLHLQFID